VEVVKGDMQVVIFAESMQRCRTEREAKPRSSLLSQIDMEMKVVDKCIA